MFSLQDPYQSRDYPRYCARPLRQRRQISAFAGLTDGYFNAAYGLGLANGETYVLKVAPPADVRVLRYEHSIMQAKVEALHMVRAHTSMPVPAVVCADEIAKLNR